MKYYLTNARIVLENDLLNAASLLIEEGLIRAIEPVAGREEMRRRRGGRSPLAVGPGRVCQALDIE